MCKRLPWNNAHGQGLRTTDGVWTNKSDGAAVTHRGCAQLTRGELSYRSGPWRLRKRKRNDWKGADLDKPMLAARAVASQAKHVLDRVLSRKVVLVGAVEKLHEQRRIRAPIAARRDGHLVPGGGLKERLAAVPLRRSLIVASGIGSGRSLSFPIV